MRYLVYTKAQHRDDNSRPTDPENIVSIKLFSKENWNVVSNMLNIMMEDKESEERRRNN